jgi:site-specific recombinase XerD
VKLFLAHVAAHSPDKPETLRRYRQLLEHFQRHIGHKRVVEAITRADIDEYKIQRRQERSERHDRLITAPTVHFEVGTLRTFFYYLINERGLEVDNPCARFKKLRDAKQKAGGRPPTYTRRAEWVFPSLKGTRLTHLLRRLRTIAAHAGVPEATLYKFRHTYGTRLLEQGADIVTPQKLMGHSDIETTRKYLNPEDELKRAAVNLLSLGTSAKAGHCDTSEASRKQPTASMPRSRHRRVKRNSGRREASESVPSTQTRDCVEKK